MGLLVSREICNTQPIPEDTDEPQNPRRYFFICSNYNCRGLNGYKVAELLVDASQRMQIVVTTHSHMLVDALSDYPSSIVVCEQENGESQFERLDGERLRTWLDQYSLGDLWSSGELGGNRW